MVPSGEIRTLKGTTPGLIKKEAIATISELNYCSGINVFHLQNPIFWMENHRMAFSALDGA